MDNKGYCNIPSTLYNECITFIVQALPLRSVPTFIELLVGAMITQAGFVTEAWLAITLYAVGAHIINGSNKVSGHG